MNWADKSVRRAKGIAPEHPVPEEPGELRNMAIELNNRAESARIGYYEGAKWQRNQLRTPEAIERAAEAVYECGEAGPYDEPGGWAHENEFNRMSSTRMAKHIINALLGED